MLQVALRPSIVYLLCQNEILIKHMQTLNYVISQKQVKWTWRKWHNITMVLAEEFISSEVVPLKK